MFVSPEMENTASNFGMLPECTSIYSNWFCYDSAEVCSSLRNVLSFETSNMTPVWVTREVLASIPLPIHQPKYSRLQGKPRSFKRSMQKNHVLHRYDTTIMLTIMTFCIVVLGWSLQVMFLGSTAEVEGCYLMSHGGGKWTLNWDVSFSGSTSVASSHM